MPERQFSGSSPRLAHLPPAMHTPALNMECITLKWRGLVERRLDHFTELQQSGRWKRYYTEDKFLTEMRAADAIVQRWTKIAPRPDELAAKL